MKRSIYTYTNFREFIRDTYEHLKETEKMTLRDFARKAGFSSHTFLSNVISGSRSLTIESAGKFGRAFNLKPEHRTYLELMVRFANAKTVDEKNDVYEQMCASSPPSEMRKIGAEFYEIFRDAYVLTVRDLVTLAGFKPEGKWIAKKMQSHIKPAQAERALKILLSSKLLEKDEEGKLRQVNSDLTTGSEVRSLAISLYHKQLLDLAAKSIDETPAGLRDISSLTLNISKSEFNFIKRRTAKFRLEILEFLKGKREVVAEEFPEEMQRAIYYLNMQFFNATNIPW